MSTRNKVSDCLCPECGDVATKIEGLFSVRGWLQLESTTITCEDCDIEFEVCGGCDGVFNELNTREWPDLPRGEERVCRGCFEFSEAA